MQLGLPYKALAASMEGWEGQITIHISATSLNSVWWGNPGTKPSSPAPLEVPQGKGIHLRLYTSFRRIRPVEWMKVRQENTG